MNKSGMNETSLREYSTGGQWFLQTAIILVIAAAFATGGYEARYFAGGFVLLFAIVGIAICAFLILGRPGVFIRSGWALADDFLVALLLFWAVLHMLPENLTTSGASVPFWLFTIAAWLFSWATVNRMTAFSAPSSWQSILGIAIPALFGLAILFLWEVIVRGAGVPFVLLPPPSAIGAKFMASIPLLAADFNQTVLKAVLFGFVVGSLAGFLVAVLADRYRFLANGLLPIGNMVSALPIIGIAPIMVIWFGFDWSSKAAVVIVMTFFPMLVNTLEGLKASGNMERDLMRTYAASHWQTLLKLRLPAAMPFVFNALKINSTLAMIGAIVAEFFGTPVVGMGFRISTEVGRMNLDMVWAEIALAAIVGSLFYGALALLERIITFWHPSYRR